MSDRIESMATKYSDGHGPVNAIAFARGVLRGKQARVRQQLRQVGWVPNESLALLAVELGDPNAPVDAPREAFVEGGRWLVQCECGGADDVDLGSLLWMCGSCFNSAHGHQWRKVLLPDTRTRQIVERALLMRPNARTRTWRSDENVAELFAENVANGLMKIGDEIVIEAEAES